MRKAGLKIDLAYYQGIRVGISNAINSFYQQNGFTSTTFNMTASMRKEYNDARSKELMLIKRLNDEGFVKSQSNRNGKIKETAI